MRLVGTRKRIIGAALAGVGLLLGPAPLAAAIPAEAIQTRYHELLGRLARGGGDELAAALADLEREATPDGGSQAVDRLWRAKLAVIRDLLASGDPSLLVPIVRLHERLYLLYMEAGGTPHLVTHSRQMAAELAQFYGQRAPDREARATAARLLVSLAGHLQGRQMLSDAAALFSWALELDRDNPAALLALGSIHEKVGQYPQAVGYLTRLAEVAPDVAEGRLRLAVNRARRGEWEAAESLLRALVTEEGLESWVAALAYQELARLREREGDLADAIAILERARGELPQLFEVSVILAFLYERSNQPRQAHQVISGADRLASPGAGPAPRARYNRWPEALLAAARRELEDEAQGPLDALARALSGSPAAAPAGVSVEDP